MDQLSEQNRKKQSNFEVVDLQEKHLSPHIEKFRTDLEPVIKKALGEMPQRQHNESLVDHRQGKCIFNDTVLFAFKSAKIREKGYQTRIITSLDTGRLPNGEFSDQVMHEHTIPVIDIPQTEKVALVDVSIAQFGPINSDLADKEVLVAIVENEETAIERACQSLFGQGVWKLEGA